MWMGVYFPFCLGFHCWFGLFFFYARVSRGLLVRCIQACASLPCSFLPVVPGGGFFVGQGQRVFSLGVAGWTVVGGFLSTWPYKDAADFVPNTGDEREWCAMLR